MRMIAILSAVAVACAGCSDASYRAKEEYGYDVAAPAADAAAAPAADAAAAPEMGAPPPGVMPLPGVNPPSPGEPVVPVGLPMLAYSYRYDLTVRAQRVQAVLTGHEQACVKAGPKVCQVVSSETQQRNADQVSGTLVLRAAPAWLKTFRDGLSADAKDAGGRLTRSEVSSEDLSRAIVDTEARLRAKTTLRNRLQNLLATRPGKLADLVELERQLAEAQGELDSLTSQLAVMRGRVAMSDITLIYESPAVATSNGGVASIGRALGEFIDLASESVAVAIRTLAVALPWLLLAGGVLWLFRKRLLKLRWPFGKKTPAP